MTIFLSEHNKAVPRAHAVLADAPNDVGINKLINDHQVKYMEVHEKYKDEAFKAVYWQGRVDERDLFKVKGNNIIIEHIRFDQILETTEEFSTPLPAKEYTVVVRNIQSKSFGLFVLKQPSAKNDFLVSLYLSDYHKHSNSWWKFVFYHLPPTPEEFGLAVPMEK